ncbi:RICIN domain-containing protein [Micromonospora fluostatini]|uniref:RICIN domain-containing protein n=1 Tax=Micromonospora sp. JCM 30529 TaxID=3421643 RepID=UPI003D18387B
MSTDPSPGRRTRRVTGWLGAVTVVAALAAVPAGPASATAVPGDPAPNTTHLFLLRNKQNGWCLDGNAGGSVYALPCRPDHPYHQWLYSGLDMTWRQVNLDRCLYGNENRAVATTGWFCAASGTYTSWLNRATGTAAEYMIYNYGTDMCLDSNDEYNPGSNTKKVFLSGCNADDRGQRWIFDTVGAA